MTTILPSLPAQFVWPISVVFLGFVLSLLLGNEYAFARPSRRTKDVAYLPKTAQEFNPERHILDIYTPRRESSTARSVVARPVVVFIHGGNWTTGSKNLYAFIGRRLAKQGVVAVVINYRLSPAVEVPAMADDCARAVSWVVQHIDQYGGDPTRIFTMGHSAGGGLAALLATDNQLFSKAGLTQNPVKGVVLDDPAGLDMYDYLTKMQYPGDAQYLVSFGKNPDVWRAVSPMYCVEAKSPPMLLYVGEKTYPSIINSTTRFRERLQQLGVKHEFAVLAGKKHVAMITQLFWKKNRIYRELLTFVQNQK